jgi:hypothetical protein
MNDRRVCRSHSPFAPTLYSKESGLQQGGKIGVIYRTDESQAACPWCDGRAVSETIGGMTAALELNDNTDFRLLQERKEKRGECLVLAQEPRL